MDDTTQSVRPNSDLGKIRVFIADDHDVVREGLRSILLSTTLSIEVSGEACTGAEAVEKISELKPDVAIVDISMPELNGLEVARRIRKTSPETSVLILTVHESEQLMEEVLSAGARGYVLKSDAARCLVMAIESLFAGGFFLNSRLGDLMVQGYLSQASSRPPGGSVLTSSEREVLQLLAEGRSNKQVAALKGISVKTVETHRANIMRKLKLRSTSGLVHYAVRNGMIQA
jgi:DNA-binding NarL/FixJ family response regulator